MLLSVSNLAWPTDEKTEVYNILKANGIEGVELAPYKYFNSWGEDAMRNAIDTVCELDKFGLRVSSFQAITYKARDINFMNSEKEASNFLEHIGKVAKMLSIVHGDFAIFGSPSLRENSIDDDSILVKLFREIGNVFSGYNLKFAIETVPAYYGAEWLNSIDTTDEFIKKVNHPSIVRHYDTGCQYLSGDFNSINRNAFIEQCEHLHISEVDLASFSIPSNFNTEISHDLARYYSGKWCVLEMLDKNFDINLFRKSIENFRELYS